MRQPVHSRPSTASVWVFRWKDPDGSLVPKLTALAITGLGFALMITLVRIEVSPPPGWAENRAGVIHLPEGGDGRAWRLRALEDGPSPSRFDPTTWQGAAALDAELCDAARLPTDRYLPELQRLPPEIGAPAVPLARNGERVFPERRGRESGAANLLDLAAEARPPVPFIFPLSGIAAGQMPERLPPIEAVEPAMTGVEWRFLLRLATGGGVAECVSITRTDPATDAALEQWFGRVIFPAEAPEGWVSVGLVFTQQTEEK
jgi:hypothetical protein